MEDSGWEMGRTEGWCTEVGGSGGWKMGGWMHSWQRVRGLGRGDPEPWRGALARPRFTDRRAAPWPRLLPSHPAAGPRPGQGAPCLRATGFPLPACRAPQPCGPPCGPAAAAAGRGAGMGDPSAPFSTPGLSSSLSVYLPWKRPHSPAGNGPIPGWAGNKEPHCAGGRRSGSWAGLQRGGGGRCYRGGPHSLQPGRGKPGCPAPGPALWAPPALGPPCPLPPFPGAHPAGQLA